jgi:hypothetical protein
MSMAPRDREALDLVRGRSFAGTWLASLDLELQTRRLTLRIYGPLRTGSETYLATLTFFGAAMLRVENDSEAFPESVSLTSLSIAYDDEEELGAASLTGTRTWSLAWSFDGLSYEEQPAVIASFADDG